MYKINNGSKYFYHGNISVLSRRMILTTKSVPDKRSKYFVCSILFSNVSIRKFYTLFFELLILDTWFGQRIN